MKWMIASDLHGSAYYCRALLQAWDREQADRLILLGDLLYHGPRNDLPREYAPKEVLAMLNQRKESLLCVRGNCDSEVDQMVLAFPILADYGVLALGGRLLYLTHGHVFHKDHLPASPGGRHPAAWAHPYSRMGDIGGGTAVLESWLRRPAQGGQPPQLYDS